MLLQSSLFQPHIDLLESELLAPTGMLAASGIQLQVPVIEPLTLPEFSEQGMQVAVLRLDKIHPIVSGNKWFKLKYNFSAATQQNSDVLITFGGAWSNHLHAYSYLGAQLGLRTIAIIRGEEWQHRSNPLLDDLRAWGTEIIAISRQAYKQRNNPEFQQDWLRKYPRSYLIPEGGDNFLGLLGVASLCQGLPPSDQQWIARAHGVALACGTANTFIGLRLALPASIAVWGVSALKNTQFPASIRQRLVSFWPLAAKNWHIFSELHGGGFGKVSDHLRRFMASFESQSQLQLDPVYTAKLLWGVSQLAQTGFFPPGYRLLLVHTGGLQGRRSLA